MTTDPGDLVLDPTCGSGTTAYVAEQWGRRWITIDTSRVASALVRARVMGARYPWYLLSDSPEGQRQEAEIARRVPCAPRLLLVRERPLQGAQDDAVGRDRPRCLGHLTERHFAQKRLGPPALAASSSSS